jgi:hypothetical protein
MPLLGAGIAAGSSLIGGFLQSRAPNKAGKIQSDAGLAVSGQIDKSTAAAVDAGYKGIEQADNAVDAGIEHGGNYIRDAQGKQKNIYDDMRAGLDPYRDAGTLSLSRLQAQGDFAFNPKDLENEPGYQFQLAQGLKALQAGAAGRGMLQSGSLLKSMSGFNQGLAGTSYQNAFNRALSTYDTNRAGYQTLANMGQTANAQGLQAGGIYGGQLTSLAGLGTGMSMQGAGMKSTIAQQGNQYVGDVGLRGTMASGDARLGAANARAAGTVGAGNAWAGALGGVANAANFYSLSQMGADAPPQNGGNAWGMPPMPSSKQWANPVYSPAPGLPYLQQPDWTQQGG